MTDGTAGVVLLSLRVALAAVLVSLPFGVAAGWVLARKPFPGRLLLDGIVHLPLVLPPVVTGYALLVVFSPAGPFGGLGLVWSWKGAAVASAVVAFPLLVRAVRLGFEAVDPGLLEAAHVTGASPARAFFTISLPLAAPGVLAGSLLAFGRSLGEFGATITFAGMVPGETSTLPVAVWAALQTPGGEDEARALALISTVLAFLTLVAGEALARGARWRR